MHVTVIFFMTLWGISVFIHFENVY